MTDITELAQRNELLIANGQQTADLLRHLADNEIDSDYFAVVSECESYGKETDAELSITEFALRAAGYVDALVEALEKAQHRIDELENDEVRQRLANAEHQLYMAELAKHNLKASRKAQFRKRRAAEKRIAELEEAEQKLCAANVTLDARAELAERQLAELESRPVTVKLPDLRQVVSGDRYVWSDGVFNYSQDVKAELTAKGIKVEAE
ncbi:hypothetical protein H8K37_00345 [Klebsiella pneumoniae]|nr:hypothetical protein [Klebsiella pneumoniae]